MSKLLAAAAAGATAALAASYMLNPKRTKQQPIVLVVWVEIAPDRIDKFLEAMAIDVEGSRKEPGCLRFDLLHDEKNPNRFCFYEVVKRCVSEIRALALCEHGFFPSTP